MKLILNIIGKISLILLVLAGSMFYTDQIDLDKAKLYMLIMTVIWFVCAGINAYTQKE